MCTHSSPFTIISDYFALSNVGVGMKATSEEIQKCHSTLPTRPISYTFPILARTDQSRTSSGLLRHTIVSRRKHPVEFLHPLMLVVFDCTASVFEP
ncbi:hypothetical protein VKT23_018267 [Stygiomarasmius scandens]|uniref:Uncharacterized protein n=1 Tax=Marasmiellus scandens TaxID=2682957 RepID=A0ABR1IU05_9AGAR